MEKRNNDKKKKKHYDRRVFFKKINLFFVNCTKKEEKSNVWPLNRKQSTLVPAPVGDILADVMAY